MPLDENERRFEVQKVGVAERDSLAAFVGDLADGRGLRVQGDVDASGERDNDR